MGNHQCLMKEEICCMYKQMLRISVIWASNELQNEILHYGAGTQNIIHDWQVLQTGQRLL